MRRPREGVRGRRGLRGEEWKDGEEIIDCGGGERTAPSTCALNNAAVGELCADFKDLNGPWYVCRDKTTASCFAKPCWHRIVAPTQVTRMFVDPLAYLRRTLFHSKN